MGKVKGNFYVTYIEVVDVNHQSRVIFQTNERQRFHHCGHCGRRMTHTLN